MDEKGLKDLRMAAPAVEGVNEKAAFNPRPHRFVRSEDSYRTGAEVLAKIRGNLEASSRDGICYFLCAVDSSGAIADEWTAVYQNEEVADRAVLVRDFDRAAEYIWLAVESANRAEAYFRLKGSAERRIKSYLGPNTALVADLHATASLLSKELETALPGWPILGVFSEQLKVLSGQVVDLEKLYDGFCSRDFKLFNEIAESGGLEKKPLNVLNAVLDFGREVHEAVGLSMGCLDSFSGLGVSVYDAVQNASRFCRKSGVGWVRILDMAESLKFRRVWGGGDSEVPEPSAQFVRSNIAPDTARAFAELLAGEASHAPAGPSAAPTADKPDRIKGRNGKRNSRGNGHDEEDSEDEVTGRAKRRVSKRRSRQEAYS